MARRRAFRSSTDGCQGGPYALRKPLFRDGRVADVDQLATARRDSCRLDKGDWPVLVTDVARRMSPSSTAAIRYSLVHQAWFIWLGSKLSSHDRARRIVASDLPQPHRQAGLE